jgi:hypothetical protein
MRAHLDRLGADAYWLTEKSDGERMMMLVCDAGTYLFGRRLEFRRFETDGVPPGTLLDGEWVTRPTPVYLVYDALCVAGRRYTHLDLPRRLGAAATVLPATLRGPAGDAPIHLKTYYRGTTARHLAETVLPALAHDNDGVVLTPAAEPYRRGRQDTLYKWKSHEQHTVDLRAKFQWSHNNNALDGNRVVELWTQTQHVFTVPLSAVPADLRHGDIAEFSLFNDGETGEVTPRYVRERTDKTRPNADDTVTGVVESWGEAIRLDEVVAACERV